MATNDIAVILCGPPSHYKLVPRINPGSSVFLRSLCYRLDHSGSLQGPSI